MGWSTWLKWCSTQLDTPSRRLRRLMRSWCYIELCVLSIEAATTNPVYIQPNTLMTKQASIGILLVLFTLVVPPAYTSCSPSLFPLVVPPAYTSCSPSLFLLVVPPAYTSCSPSTAYKLPLDLLPIPIVTSVNSKNSHTVLTGSFST